MQIRRPGLSGYLGGLVRRAVRTYSDLVRIMLPVMILVRIGEEFGLSQMLGGWLGPVMGLAGLPAEAGLVWAVCLVTGLYGGVGAYLTLMPELNLTIAQHSILCAMMLTAHAIPVEQAIVRRAGASFMLTSLLRILVAFAYAMAATWFCAATDSLSAPLPPVWLAAGFAEPGWAAWALALARSLVSIFVIIVLLLVLLDGLRATGIMQRSTVLLSPVLRVIGLDPRLAPVTTIGLLMGLAYGGGLIIQAFKEQPYSRNARFLALVCMSLIHGLIEDTALMLAVGADIRIILFGRLVFTLAIVATLALLVNRGRDAAVDE
jgi:hypothetical protein